MKRKRYSRSRKIRNRQRIRKIKCYMMRVMFTAACFFAVWLSVFFFAQTTSIGGSHKQETSQTLESSQDVLVEKEMPKVQQQTRSMLFCLLMIL